MKHLAPRTRTTISTPRSTASGGKLRARNRGRTWTPRFSQRLELAGPGSPPGSRWLRQPPLQASHSCSCSCCPASANSSSRSAWSRSSRLRCRPSSLVLPPRQRHRARPRRHRVAPRIRENEHAGARQPAPMSAVAPPHETGRSCGIPIGCSLGTAAVIQGVASRRCAGGRRTRAGGSRGRGRRAR